MSIKHEARPCGDSEEGRTLKHVLDQDGALYDFSVDLELDIVGRGEVDHFAFVM